MKIYFTIVTLLFSLPIFAEQQKTKSNKAQKQVAKALHTTRFDISMPLRLIYPKAIVTQDKRGGHLIDPGPIKSDGPTDSFETDKVAQTKFGTNQINPPTASFVALTNLSGVSPPDPNGDVGPNHVVVMSNLSFHILDKSGVSVFGPAANNTLWSGFGGACENENSGDPVILYDQIADRWLLSQFTSAGPEFFNCVAVSMTADPTGRYFRWAISNGNIFPDYPKYGIWSDGYYFSTRDFDNGSYVGVGVYAMKRDDMINGNPTPAIVHIAELRGSNPWRVGDGLLPADIDGFNLPPVGAPEYFLGTMDDGFTYGAAQDALLLWKFDVDFDTPSNSTFTLADTLTIDTFDTVFPCSGGRNCIDQLDTTNKIDIQSYRQRPLHRLAYRNFGSHESMVATQSVEGAQGIAGMRWWEIRNPSSTAVLHQEGTYVPGATDGIHRWMGSVAMDGEGNMALAYSASNANMYPGIRYSGRLASDPLGEMTFSEGSIVEGGGSQTGNARWGDYTSLTVDPIDDCTFWNINQYYETTSDSNWNLRAGAFKFDQCGDPGFYLRANTNTASVCVGTDANFDLTIGSISNFSSPVTLTFSGIPNTTTASFSVNPVATLPNDTILTLSDTATATNGSYTITVTGTANGADLKTTNMQLNVFETLPPVATLVSPTNGQLNVDVMPSLNWSGGLTQEYQIELASDESFNTIINTSTTAGNTIVPNINLNTNTIYYWRVKANNSCGESVYSSVFSFRTIPAPGDCNAGFSTVNTYRYGFENGLNNWSTSALVGNNTWVESTNNPNSGTTSMHVDDSAIVSDQVLTSPLISLPLNELPLTLQFANNQSLENRIGGCYDGAILEISTDRGATFTQIATDKLLTDPYDGPIDGGFNNPLSGVQAWCGDPQDWLNSIVNISDYEGQNVIFRFRLATDSSQGADGWSIDDVKIQSCRVLIDNIFANGFEQ